jgi:hypothetical protein
MGALVAMPKDRIAFTSGTTESINLFLRGFLSPGDLVLTTAFEHASLARPLRELQSQLGIRVRVLDPDDGLSLSVDAVRSAMLESEPRLFAFSHASNVTGSLLDAAAAFDRLASPGARLFVLGGMAELGADSVRLHRECGARLPLRAGDHVVAFGGDAPAFLTDLSCPGVRTTVADTLAVVTSLVAAHRGAVFLKGSRAFALERVLPSSVRAALTFH